MFLLRVITIQANIMKRKFGQEWSILLITFTQMLLNFGKINFKDYIHKFLLMEYGSTWMNHQIFKEMNQSLKAIKFNITKIKIWWLLMPIYITILHFLMIKFMLTMVIFLLYQLINFLKSMEDRLLLVEVIV